MKKALQFIPALLIVFSVIFGIQMVTAQGPDDTDEDGIPDIRDACPTVAGIPENLGCPFADQDGDTVQDEVDECRDTFGAVNNQGCPLPNDSDGDGVTDNVDACPQVVGPASNSGCPLPPDSDGDGLLDPDDACPSEAGPANNDGCPLPPDSDGDGVTDDVDICPSEIGTAANDGCPPPVDTDGDTLSDSVDQCPNVAGPRQYGGCPDTDEDRVPDQLDQCPNDPGPEPTGCPSGDSDGDTVPDDVDICPNLVGTPEAHGCEYVDLDVDGVMDNVDVCPNEAGTPERGGCPDLNPVFVITAYPVILQQIVVIPDVCYLVVVNMIAPPLVSYQAEYTLKSASGEVIGTPQTFNGYIAWNPPTPPDVIDKHFFSLKLTGTAASILASSVSVRVTIPTRRGIRSSGTSVELLNPDCTFVSLFQFARWRGSFSQLTIATDDSDITDEQCSGNGFASLYCQ
ncbi:MAG: thrombospondin type 3 repeat-containing protein [Chloroflexi bacterium]|nr:thrombospondin type 3 repeat-containing protein [Chloroflexota bacterium]